ncbi:MAG: hypothetical protein WCK67_08600 [bacterium]
MNDFIRLSQELFYINEILLIPETVRTLAATTQIINRGKTIKIERLVDTNYFDSYILISCGNLFVSRYADFIKTLQKDTSLSFDTKKKQVLEALYKLDTFSKAHNINNRFSFASKNILKVKCSNGNENVDYNNVQIKIQQNNILREFFVIRQEIFSELLNISNSYLYNLEYNAFKYSKFQMDEEKGKYLLHEFILGLEVRNEFINLSTEELQQLEKLLFQLFGLKPPAFGRMRDKVLKRLSPAKALDTLSKNVESISAEFKKLRNK